MAPTQRRRERLLLPLAIVAACAGATVGVVLSESRRAEGLVEREDAALAGLLRVADAERAHAKRTGRHGWIEDLRAAGLLDGDSIGEEGGRAFVRLEGYRVDVLLPAGFDVAGRTRIVLRGKEPVDEALAALQFAVVARPDEPGVTGLRAWYVDARGIVKRSDGVLEFEDAREAPLPPTLLVDEVPELDRWTTHRPR
jgi:hypothetical protein